MNLSSSCGQISQENNTLTQVSLTLNSYVYCLPPHDKTSTVHFKTEILCIISLNELFFIKIFACNFKLAHCIFPLVPVIYSVKQLFLYTL